MKETDIVIDEERIKIDGKKANTNEKEVIPNEMGYAYEADYDKSEIELDANVQEIIIMEQYNEPEKNQSLNNK